VARVLPIRSELVDSTSFDRDALLWRDVQRLLGQLPPADRPTEEEVGRSRTLARAGRWFSLLVGRVRSVPPPEAWVVCEKCHGSGASQLMGMGCALCEGTGFVLPLT
jgi:hypothetical protein